MGCILVNEKREMYSGTVFKIDDYFIFIEIDESNEDFRYIYAEQTFDINFHVNRHSYQLQLNALKYIEEHKLFSILISNPLFKERKMISSHSKFEFVSNEAEKLNDMQKRAVKNIVLANNRPVPFLLFGPPGTGKTRTIVAAIVEIVRSSEDFVLVCAQSNCACDELTERLLNVLNDNEVFRMYAKSMDSSKICSKIKPACNLKNGQIKFPGLNYLYQFRVVVCTLQTAGCISRARGCDPHFDSGHFSYIFLDEAACTHESVSMIPIAGLYFIPFENDMLSM